MLFVSTSYDSATSLNSVTPPNNLSDPTWLTHFKQKTAALDTLGRLVDDITAPLFLSIFLAICCSMAFTSVQYHHSSLNIYQPRLAPIHTRCSFISLTLSRKGESAKKIVCVCVSPNRCPSSLWINFFFSRFFVRDLWWRIVSPFVRWFVSPFHRFLNTQPLNHSKNRCWLLCVGSSSPSLSLSLSLIFFSSSSFVVSVYLNTVYPRTGIQMWSASFHVSSTNPTLSIQVTTGYRFSPKLPKKIVAAA